MSDLAYKIQYALWPDGRRWAALPASARAWVQAWGWGLNVLWRGVLRPHVMPRRWERERHDLNERMRIPPQINAFLIGEGGRYCAHLIEQGGPWDLCCIAGEDDSLEGTKAEVMDYLRYWAEEAGTWSRDGGYAVQWHEREPTPADRTFTR